MWRRQRTARAKTGMRVDEIARDLRRKKADEEKAAEEKADEENAVEKTDDDEGDGDGDADSVTNDRDARAVSESDNDDDESEQPEDALVGFFFSFHFSCDLIVEFEGNQIL
jgi:hypothetical protein